MLLGCGTGAGASAAADGSGFGVASTATWCSVTGAAGAGAWLPDIATAPPTAPPRTATMSTAAAVNPPPNTGRFTGRRS
jgi:hypothetical protein